MGALIRRPGASARRLGLLVLLFTALVATPLAGVAADDGQSVRWFVVENGRLRGDLRPHLQDCPIVGGLLGGAGYLDLARPGDSEFTVEFTVEGSFRPRYLLLDLAAYPDNRPGQFALLGVWLNDKEVNSLQFGLTDYVTHGYEIGDSLVPGRNTVKVAAMKDGPLGLRVRGLFLSPTSSLSGTLDALDPGLPPWVRAASIAVAGVCGVALVWLGLHAALRRRMKFRPLVFGAVSIAVASLAVLFSFLLLPSGLVATLVMLAFVVAVFAAAYPLARRTSVSSGGNVRGA